MCSVDVRAFETYQRIFTYTTFINTNLRCFNTVVKAGRLRWFSKQLKDLRMSCNIAQTKLSTIYSGWSDEEA